MLTEAFILVTFDNYSHQEFACEEKVFKMQEIEKNLLKPVTHAFTKKIGFNSAIFERTDRVKSAKK